jgi:acyl-CoA synthetase (AMP-forming)/AMP-acid ligase II
VGLQAEDNYLVINPFFHTFGYKAGWLASLIRGARIFPVPAFDVLEVLRCIQFDRITMLPGPPTVYQTLLAHPDRASYDLSSLRLAVTGAASVPVELIRRMRSELGFQTVLTAYGLTETCGVVTITAASDEPELIATTAGRAMPGVEVECVSPSGQVVPPGEPGEVRVRGYNVMQGYFDDPAATAETITPEGWLMTGDIGVMNEAGYLRITDRIKDMFIVGGFNVYPAEIENLLCSLNGVAQAAVIGVPDERMGEIAKAFIVRRPGSELSAEDVIAWSRRNMANYKVPRSVEFLDALPLNAAGKVLKTALRERT